MSVTTGSTSLPMPHRVQAIGQREKAAPPPSLPEPPAACLCQAAAVSAAALRAHAFRTEAALSRSGAVLHCPSARRRHCGAQGGDCPAGHRLCSGDCGHSRRARPCGGLALELAQGPRVDRVARRKVLDRGRGAPVVGASWTVPAAGLRSGPRLHPLLFLRLAPPNTPCNKHVRLHESCKPHTGWAEASAYAAERCMSSGTRCEFHVFTGAIRYKIRH